MRDSAMRYLVAATLLVACTRDPRAEAVPNAQQTSRLRPVFESELLTEGEHGVKSVATTIAARRAPYLDTDTVEILRVPAGSKLEHDSVRNQSIVPGLLRVMTDVSLRGTVLGRVSVLTSDMYYFGRRRDTVALLARDSIVKYLQERGEGYCLVSIEGTVVETRPCPTTDGRYRLVSPLTTLIWVRVRRGEIAGWIPVDGISARFVP